MVESRRIRRAVWPADPGTFRRALVDMFVGFAVLVFTAAFSPAVEYAYVLRAAANSEHKVAGIGLGNTPHIDPRNLLLNWISDH